MTYARIDVDMLDHPKFEGLDDDTVLLYLAGVLHAAKWLTDGRLGYPTVTRLFKRRSPRSRRLETVVSQLLEAGLWEEDEDGYVIHDYTDWQRTKVEVEEQKRRGRERTARWRGGSNGD